MMSIAHGVMLAWGWKRRCIAFLSGACGALALAPVDFLPAMFVPMIVGVWLVDGSVQNSVRADGSGQTYFGSMRGAASAGWWMGFGYFVAGLWWLGSAVLVEPDKFLWALPFAVLGLPAGLAIFTAIGFALARLLWSHGSGRTFGFAAGLGAAEWLRGNLLTGFPWNLFGMALGGNLVMAQFASLIGAYGLTFAAIYIFASPATLVREPWLQGSQGKRPSWLRTQAFAALLLFIGMGAFGVVRLAKNPTQYVSGVKLRIVQPNVQQDDRFRPENKERILAQYIALSDRATSPQSNGVGDATHLFWPESAFPFILSRDPASLSRIGAMLGEKTILLTGAARIGEAPPVGGSSRRTQAYFNSVQVIGRGGIIQATYDKSHLVPFGEYLPLASYLEKAGLRQFVQVPGGFEAAPFRKALQAPGLPTLAALICYEAVFPGEVMPNDGSNANPGVILNLTNDGWFGLTSGPYQHFAQARLRSVEQGLPMIRAANSGISAIIDGNGRILQSLPLGTEGVFDGQLPQRLSQTFFSAHPLLPGLAIFLLFAMAALLVKFRRPGL